MNTPILVIERRSINRQRLGELLDRWMTDGDYNIIIKMQKKELSVERTQF